jgi:integrase
MPARLVKIGRGRVKVRWRDGRKHPKTGRYIESSTGEMSLAEAMVEKRRLDAEQVKRRQLKRALDGRLLGLPAVLDLWKRTALARAKIRATYALEVETVLTALFAARRWSTCLDVTPAAIDAWLTAKRPGKAAGVGTDKPLQMLKTMLRYAAGTLRQPVDPLVLVTQKRHRIKRPAPPLLREVDVDWILALAQVRGGDEALDLLDHLATYGCRPVDACRLLVGDFDARARTVTLRDTKNRQTVTHPLLPRHVERYRQLIRGRRREEPLFRNPKREAWRITKLGQAGQLVDWYTANVSEHLLEPEQWGLYCLKDYAISRMDALGIDDRTKALFTGHKTLGVFERYKATNRERANDAVRRIEQGANQGL